MQTLFRSLLLSCRRRFRLARCSLLFRSLILHVIGMRRDLVARFFRPLHRLGKFLVEWSAKNGFQS